MTPECPGKSLWCPQQVGSFNHDDKSFGEGDASANQARSGATPAARTAANVALNQMNEPCDSSEGPTRANHSTVGSATRATQPNPTSTPRTSVERARSSLVTRDPCASGIRRRPPATIFFLISGVTMRHVMKGSRNAVATVSLAISGLPEEHEPGFRRR